MEESERRMLSSIFLGLLSPRMWCLYCWFFAVGPDKWAKPQILNEILADVQFSECHYCSNCFLSVCDPSKLCMSACVKPVARGISAFPPTLLLWLQYLNPLEIHFRISNTSCNWLGILVQSHFQSMFSELTFKFPPGETSFQPWTLRRMLLTIWILLIFLPGFLWSPRNDASILTSLA